MKKLLLLLVAIFSLGNICMAENGIIHRERHPQTYYKGNISPNQLPKTITKYLDKEYPGYTIIRSKRKNNGNYFVKIRFQGNKYRPYYRSLVFSHDGEVIKG